MRILQENLIPSILLLLASALCYSTTQAAAFPAQFDPRRMSADEGWLFTGTTTESAMGGVAQGIGDINGDGYTDFIIGTGPYTESPAHYLVYGNPAGYDTMLPAGGSDAGGRVYLGGLLRFVSLGDFNGDGFDDWLYQPVSTTSYPPDVPLDHLDAYIVLGQADSYGVFFDVGSADTIRLLGTFPVDSNYTSRVHTLGDVNGDGFSDLLVIESIEYDQESATAWLIPGRAGPLPGSIDPATMPASQTTSIRFPNPDYGLYDDYIVPPWVVQSEIWVDSGGDINGDGLDDFIIFDTWNGGPQQVYVVFGAGTSLPPLIDADTLDGSNGLWIANNRTGGLEEGVREFSDIALVRDTDGDGVDDLLVGTRSDMENTQLVYVVPGRSEWPARLDVATLPAIGIFSVQGSGFNPISNVGDINGDGLGDWMMAGDSYSPTGVAIIYGQSDSATDLVLDELDGTRGFTVQPTLRMDNFYDFRWPWNAADIGDSNGDGIDDLLLGDNYTLGPIENWTDYLDEWYVDIPNTGLAALILGRPENDGPAAPDSLYPAYAREFIELRWKLDDTTNVDRVELSRNGEFIASLDPNVWRYEDTTAARDTNYTYDLVAIDTAGQRSASVFLSARNDHEHYPVLAGEVYSSTLAELFWVDDGNDPFFDNRYYDIYHDGEMAGTRKALSWLDENYTPTGHHYFIDTNPERYRDDYRLRSDDLYLPPDAGTRAPASVGNPRIELLSPETLKIAWDAAAWGVEPLRYELQRRFSDDELLVSTTDTFVTVEVPHIDDELGYGGLIVTIDAYGRRSSPMPFYAYMREPLRALLPGEPTGLSATQTNDTSTTITWQVSDVGTTPAGFEINRDGEVIARTGTPEFTDSGLAPDTLYRYRVRSLDSEGRRSLAINQMLRVLTTGGPFLPERVDALAYGPTTVEVLWPRAESGASFVAEYRVYRDGELIATVDALSLIDEGLVPGMTYTYAVRSSTSGGRIVSEGSVTTMVTTPAR